MARTNNTLILPSNVGDVSSLVGQAMAIYNTVSKHNVNDPGYKTDKTIGSDHLLQDSTQSQQINKTLNSTDPSLLVNETLNHIKLENDSNK